MKEIWVYLATAKSWFDEGTIVQFIDQKESDSYFRGVGTIRGVPTIVEDIFFDDVEFVKLETRE